MDAIVNGIISGTIAGLTVFILLGVYRQIAKQLRRQGQISHTREIIVSGREQIYGISGESDPTDPHKPSPDNFRYVFFQAMRRELELALDSRSSEIAFDEIREIRRTFISDDLIRGSAPDKHPTGLQHYHNIFGDLEKIEWLKLSKRGSAV